MGLGTSVRNGSRVGMPFPNAFGVPVSSDAEWESLIWFTEICRRPEHVLDPLVPNA